MSAIEKEGEHYVYVKSYLASLWFEERQSDIFLITYTYGPKPASSIASMCGTERSYCYKVLDQFVAQWLVDYMMVQGVRQYYVANPDVLLQKIESQATHIADLKEKYVEARWALSILKKQNVSYIPKTQQYVGIEGIKQRYDDILQSIKVQNLLVVNCTITSTFVSSVTRFLDIQKMYNEFVSYLDEQHIVVHWKIWSGSLVIENMSSILDKRQLDLISVGNQSIQLWIIWEITYIWFFRELPVGIKIDSLDMADLLQTMIWFINK